MPEAEAKKKAYEYMRKKMGLTADNPFTEANEGGTKSAYNDSGKNTEVILPSKTDIPKALINRMKDNQKIMGDRAGNIKIRNIGGN